MSSMHEVNTIRNLETVVNRESKVQAAGALNDLLDRHWTRLGAAMNVPSSRIQGSISARDEHKR